MALLYGARAPQAAFERDWVAVHELCHQLHPFFSPRRTWLSEGLATWYQTVTRWRSGRLSEAQAWSKLLWGIDAGRGEVGGRTLEELSRQVFAAGWKRRRATSASTA